MDLFGWSLKSHQHHRHHLRHHHHLDQNKKIILNGCYLSPTTSALTNVGSFLNIRLNCEIRTNSIQNNIADTII